MNVYQVGETKEIEILGETVYHKKYEDYSFHRYGHFVFQKSTSKNMNKLWLYFHKNETYPEFYIGFSKKMAICKCCLTGKEGWYNGQCLVQIENPKKGSIVTLDLCTKNSAVRKDFIFIGWVQTPVHEWRMKNGTTLQLEQNFIDGLLPEEKRYLKIIR